MPDYICLWYANATTVNLLNGRSTEIFFKRKKRRDFKSVSVRLQSNAAWWQRT